jgi:hypothetical protein
MAFNFGIDITYQFYPLKDEIASDTWHEVLSITEAPTIYIFNFKPDRSIASAGTNALATVSSWSNTQDGRGKKFTIPAIDDPNPTSATDAYSYYIAINFKLQSGEQTQTVIRLLPIRRIVAHHSSARPLVEDIQSLHPEIRSFFKDSQIESAIQSAEYMTKGHLKVSGYDYASIWNPDELKTQITYQALALLCLSQIESGGAWEAKYNEYKSISEGILASITVLIDVDKNGEPDKKAQTTTVINLIR